MSDLSAIYLTLTVLVFLICRLARAVDPGAGDLFVAATVVLLFASMSVVVRIWFPAPWSQAGNPVQDALCLALFAGAYESTRQRWAAALAIMFLVQIGVHAGYWTTGDFGNHARRIYAIKINTLYCGELAVLFVTGGGHVFRNHRHLPDLLRLRGVAGLARVE